MLIKIVKAYDKTPRLISMIYKMYQQTMTKTIENYKLYYLILKLVDFRWYSDTIYRNRGDRVYLKICSIEVTNQHFAYDIDIFASSCKYEK